MESAGVADQEPLAGGDRDPAGSSDGPSGGGAVPGEIDLVVLVETPQRVMVRHVPAASPLRAGQPSGPAAEAAASDAASEWGLPDFVFTAAPQRTGSGVREVGDRLLVVGGRGLVVQVKCRDAPSQSRDRERRWLERNIKKGIAQARGSIRFLQEHHIEATNVRGRTHKIGPEVSWTGVVVIDHPDPPRVDSCAGCG